MAPGKVLCTNKFADRILEQKKKKVRKRRKESFNPRWELVKLNDKLYPYFLLH